MTEEKKLDDNDRKKVSDEEMEDVAGGIQEYCANGTFRNPKGKKKPSTGIVGNPYPSPSSRAK